jgi:hypothetical protein
MAYLTAEATTLESEYYEIVQSAMACPNQQNGELASVAIDTKCIMYGLPDLFLGASYDRTLTSQLKALFAQHNPPDLYLFTAKSAIPVADAFRGIFGEGINQSLGTINANSRNSRKHIDALKAPDSQAIFEHQAEVERLRKVIGNTSSVCVVEQYSGSGRTLRYAGKLLQDAGVETIHGIRGQWYHDALEADIDENGLTSTHSSFMRSTGELIRGQLEIDLTEIRT